LGEEGEFGFPAFEVGEVVFAEGEDEAEAWA
jgi:hypothetical protein